MAVHLDEAISAIKTLILWCRQNKPYEEYEPELLELETELKEEEKGE